MANTIEDIDIDEVDDLVISPESRAELEQYPYRVQLSIPTDALSPAEAVENALASILENGLRTWSYTVTHRATGDVRVVHRGQTYTEQEYIALIESERVRREQGE